MERGTFFLVTVLLLGMLASLGLSSTPPPTMAKIRPLSTCDHDSEVFTQGIEGGSTARAEGYLKACTSLLPLGEGSNTTQGSYLFSHTINPERDISFVRAYGYQYRDSTQADSGDDDCSDCHEIQVWLSAVDLGWDTSWRQDGTHLFRNDGWFWRADTQVYCDVSGYLDVDCWH